MPEHGRTIALSELFAQNQKATAHLMFSLRLLCISLLDEISRMPVLGQLPSGLVAVGTSPASPTSILHLQLLPGCDVQASVHFCLRHIKMVLALEHGLSTLSHLLFPFSLLTCKKINWTRIFLLNNIFSLNAT